MKQDAQTSISAAKRARPKDRIDLQNAKLPPELARSRYGKWRALSLILIYVLMIIHITHWKVSGKTMAPLELSEIMKALELGVVSPGVIFIGLMLIGSLIFGRFFCSWGCHMLALQDLSHWILKKLRIRPRPIRSRVLLFVPFLTAGYMFFWPQIKRMWEGRALPEAAARITTTNFWRDLPGPLVITLTALICGFLIVYLFGGRGFCTYGCPYGVLFGFMDRLALGKIRALPGCEQCGKCTAVCTSNVRVHEEVKAYGMVVNPRCMKDLDCVSVCPNDILHYKFGRPSLARSRAEKPPSPRYDFSIPEDLAMAAIFFLGWFTWRTLYDRLPFLMSIALSVITAYVAITSARLLRRPQLDLNRYRLKHGGRLTRAGYVFATVSVMFLILFAHSGFIQYHRWQGDRYLTAAERIQPRDAAKKAARRAAWENSVAHFQACDRYGLVSTTSLEFKLGTLMLGLGRVEAAEGYLQRTVARSPTYPEARIELAHALAQRGKTRQAVNHLAYALEIYSPHEEYQPRYRHVYATAHARLGGLLVGQAEREANPDLRREQIERARAHYRAALELDEDFVDAHIGLGYLASNAGEDGLHKAVEHYQTALRLAPRSAWAHANLGDVFTALGETRQAVADREQAASYYRQAVAQYREALALDAEIQMVRFKLGFLSFRLGDLPDAIDHLAAAVRQTPDVAEVRKRYGQALLEAGRVDEARKQFERANALTKGS